jgi:hypothetical protein
MFIQFSEAELEALEEAFSDRSGLAEYQLMVAEDRAELEQCRLADEDLGDPEPVQEHHLDDDLPW